MVRRYRLGWAMWVNLPLAVTQSRLDRMATLTGSVMALLPSGAAAAAAEAQPAAFAVHQPGVPAGAAHRLHPVHGGQHRGLVRVAGPLAGGAVGHGASPPRCHASTAATKGTGCGMNHSFSGVQ